MQNKYKKFRNLFSFGLKRIYEKLSLTFQVKPNPEKDPLQLAKRDAANRLKFDSMYHWCLKRGSFKRVHTPMKRWIYNPSEEGVFQNPYIGNLHIPMPTIPKRLKEQSSFNWTIMERVEKANKYLAYQVHRLDKAKDSGNADLYWRIADALCKRSRSLHVCFLNKAAKGWYFNRDRNFAYRMMRLIPGLLSQTEIKSNRTFLEKSNGKLRPIGAPNKEWNIILAAQTWFLNKWVDDRIEDHQHGFRPGKGLWSAWIDVLTNVIDADNIYEYDFRKFFNSVPIFAKGYAVVETNRVGKKTRRIFRLKTNKYNLENALKAFDIPKYKRDWILKTCMSVPDCDLPLKDVDVKDPELWPSFISRWGKSPKPKKGLVGALDSILASMSFTYKPFFTDKKIKSAVRHDGGFPNLNLQSMREKIAPSIITKIYSFTQMSQYMKKKPHPFPPAKKEKWPEKDYLPCWYGFPQGSPMSPTLSNIFQTYWDFVSPYYAVKYADDGLLAFEGKNVNILLHLQNRIRQVLGLMFNWKKSGWIKKNGVWLKKLTFLGTTFNPWTRCLEVDGIPPFPIERLNSNNIWQIVGRTYNVSQPEKWTWEIKEDSYVMHLHKVFGINPLDPETWPVPYLSSICSAVLLEQLKLRRFDYDFFKELAP